MVDDASPVVTTRKLVLTVKANLETCFDEIEVFVLEIVPMLLVELGITNIKLLNICCTVVRSGTVFVVFSIFVTPFVVSGVGSTISDDPKCFVVVTTLFVDLVVVNFVVVLVISEVSNCVVLATAVRVHRVTGSIAALYSPFVVHMVSPAILELPKSGLFDKSQLLGSI